MKPLIGGHQRKVQDERPQMPETFPNNTILVDLNRCHENLAQIWSHPSGVKSTASTRFARDHQEHNQNYHYHNQETTGHSERQSRDSQVQSHCYPDEKQLANDESKAVRKFQMPNELIRANFKLNPDDYDKALSVLTGDIRFRLHVLLYRKLQTFWLLITSFLCFAVPVLAFAQLESFIILGVSSVWLSLQLLGLLFTSCLRRKLDDMLERSVAQVNSYFMDHHLMIGVINVGSLMTKSKFNIPMLYFDTTQCREQIESIIGVDLRYDDANRKSEQQNKCPLESYSRIGLPLTKPKVALALAQSQLAKKIVLRYSQRWISYFDKRKLLFTDDGTWPRHLSTGKCLCQFIEEQFKTNGYLKQNLCLDEQSCIDGGNSIVHTGKQFDETLAIDKLTNNADELPPTKLLYANLQTNLSDSKGIINIHKQDQLQRQHLQHHLHHLETQTFPDNRVRQQNELNCSKAGDTQIVIPTLSDLIGRAEINHPVVGEPTIKTNIKLAGGSSDHFVTIKGLDDVNDEFESEMNSNMQTNGRIANGELWPPWNQQQQHRHYHHNHYHVNQQQHLLSKINPELSNAKIHHTPVTATTMVETTKLGTNNYQSPATTSSPDTSLDPVGSESIIRSDDLVKKLRLLLELRKHELQGLDASLFSDLLFKASQQQQFANLDYSQDSGIDEQSGKCLVDNDNGINNISSDNKSSICGKTIDELEEGTNHQSVKSKVGKKLFGHKDGLFSFGGSSADKKSQQQQQQQTARSRALEIC